MATLDNTYVATLLPLYQAFTAYTPVIPKMYWDVYSQEERVKAICKEIGKIVAYANSLGIQINTNTSEIEDLIKQFDDFKEGAYDDYYEQVISAWVDKHMPEIIRQAVNMVFFGLTDTGYFCAYVPDSWADIVFDTGAVYGRSDYGHLILRYRVNGEGVIDNTYSYTAPSNVGKLVADLEEFARAQEQTSEDIQSLRQEVKEHHDTLYTDLDKEDDEDGND